MPKDVLIVDDCRLTTKVLSEAMQDLGYTVYTAPSGEDAIRFLEMHEPPSLFFVDWIMPGMSGIEVLSFLRNQETTASAPILMVTAQRDLPRVMEAIQMGANEYIMKPFTKEAIEEKLRLIGIEVSS